MKLRTVDDPRGLHRLVRCIVAICCSLSVACGGGSSLQGGGIDGSGVVVGPIEGLGSIIVGGVTFDVDSALVTLDGRDAVGSDLRLGMVVSVFGHINYTTRTGTADRVVYRDSVEGPVQSIDSPAASFVVLGQTILVDAGTTFENAGFSTLVVGDVVEISGFESAQGNIRATRVEKRDTADHGFEVTGVITALDVNLKTFSLGALPVDYGSAVIEGEPLSGLTDGLRVEVRTSVPLFAGVFVADVIEVDEEDHELREGVEIEVEGLVTTVLSETEFILSGTRQVRTGPFTEFEHGIAADIAVDVRLKADGVLDTNGILVADKVEFDEEP